MEKLDLVIAVPSQDRDALDDVASSVNQLFVTESRSLDGETVATALVSIYVTGIPLFRAWLNARVAERKGCKVTIGGDVYQGYSADDVVKIIDNIESKLEIEHKNMKGNRKSGSK